MEMRSPAMRHYCTYFDSNYLARGLVLHQSLEEHSEGGFRLYVLCLDDRTGEVLAEIGKPSIVPIPLREVERWDKELLDAKQNRSLVEYYFTLSPILPLYVLEHFDCDLVTYLDADLMFFSSPEAIFSELSDKSIFITEHRIPAHLPHARLYGRFNVQCLSFRRDEIGIASLHDWRGQCLEWCYDRVEGEKFADQKYLDEWPELYDENLVISKNPGIGVAPWNLIYQRITRRGDELMIEGKPLVFYHYSGFRAYRFFLFLGVNLGAKIFSSEYRCIFTRYFHAICDHVNTHRLPIMLENRYKSTWRGILFTAIRGGLIVKPWYNGMVPDM